MSQVGKRRIQVASFSFNDISTFHLTSVLLGAILIAGTAVMAIASNTNARAAADAKGASRVMSVAATEAYQGTLLYVGGGSERLGQAGAMAAVVSNAFSDVAASANSLMVFPSLKQPASDAYGAWKTLGSALDQISSPAGAATGLNEALGRSVSYFAALTKKMETSGRTGNNYAKAYESAIRLYTYAESGFGMASIARVDFDLRVLGSELGSTDLRQDIAFLEPLIQISKQAAGTKVSKEQLSVVYEAAKTAKSAADSLSNAASHSEGAMWLGLAAAVMASLGVVFVFAGLRGASSEFAKRYNRSIQQFRGDEDSRAQLVADLDELARGDLSLNAASSSGEFAEIADKVNRILDVVRARLDSAVDTISSSVEVGDRALQVAGSATLLGDSVNVGIISNQAALTQCADLSRDVALDSLSLVQAADEAVTRSSDATRVAQDASSRLESMREGLQDTSKRVKRLGERSQEINAVVESMELLSEQIGVLALNASLEAERAGEAGAGFRMVAKEVQALAVRSEDALNRISSLVQGVQSDARSATESVERSTAQVVAGANVGSVSQALLAVLAPLAESIGSMARTVATAASANASAISDAVSASASARRDNISVSNELSNLKSVIESGSARLRQELVGLSVPQTEDLLA